MNKALGRCNSLTGVAVFVSWIVYYFTWFVPHAEQSSQSVMDYQVEFQNAAQVARNTKEEIAELNVETKVFETEAIQARARTEKSQMDLNRLNSTN